MNKKITRSLIIVIVLISLVIYGGYSTQQTKSIVLGAILPLSGNNASYGDEIRNAIELAVHEINDSGGINGKALEVIYEDDQTNPKLGVSAIQKLVTVDHVSVVLGPWASGVALAVAPIAQKNKTILLAEAIDPSITNAGDYIFTIQPSAIQYSRKLMEIVIKKMNLKKIAIIYNNNDFGTSLRDAVIQDINNFGGQVVVQESYNPGSQDFKAQLVVIKSKLPDALFIAGYQEQAVIIRQANDIGLKTKILAGPPFENRTIQQSLGYLAEGVIYPYHFVLQSSNPKTLQYEKAYQDKFNIQTGGFAPLMYDGVYIIAEALKKCELSTECIKNNLRQTKFSGVSGEIFFNEKRNPVLPIVIKIVREGQFVEF